MERVLLVGFMGSGKSTVGRALAERLGWSFADFDAAVEASAGRSIEEIFAGEGEERFRELEARVGAELLARERVVLASGGGWPAAPGRIDALGPGTLSVFLRVSPEVAVRRAREQAAREGTVRPLLEAPDALARARALIREREPYYRRADLELDADDADPEELAGTIARRVKEGRDGTA